MYEYGIRQNSDPVRPTLPWLRKKNDQDHYYVKYLNVYYVPSYALIPSVFM